MTAAERNARRIVRDTDTALSDLDTVLAQVAVDREQLLRELRAADRRPQLAKDARRAGFLRWTWRVYDASTGKDLTTGRALTEHRAGRRAEKALLVQLDQLRQPGGEGGNRGAVDA